MNKLLARFNQEGGQVLMIVGAARHPRHSASPAKTADGAFLRVEPFDVRLVE